ncbi:pyridoxal 5'-phosphate synthase [Streptomyces sp. NPDC060194]|uniref:pyridoxine/pyridoxamine 5'-phosphate oxidase n=1 Tax=Streptomyces sp. NPDC060194 TaxID=3347069 RepID=UPI0036586979
MDHDAFTDLLRAQRVWDVELPEFDPANAPEDPLPLFRAWFAAAVEAGQPEPHAMQLATADAAGGPDVRTLLLHDADDRGWHFATHVTSAKGRQLTADPRAALHFYWPALGRQVRLRGRVAALPPEVAQAGLHARSTGALAAALTGTQSAPLASVDELAEASAAAWDRAERAHDTDAPTWTAYVLAPEEAEFFQGEAHRRHLRLHYRRTPDGTGWTRGLLWP